MCKLASVKTSLVAALLLFCLLKTLSHGALHVFTLEKPLEKLATPEHSEPPASSEPADTPLDHSQDSGDSSYIKTNKSPVVPVDSEAHPTLMSWIHTGGSGSLP